jgi:hypothetical protein
LSATNHVERGFGQAERGQLLDIAFDEADVALGITEPFAVPVEMTRRHCELFLRGVYTGHAPMLSDQLREQVGILPRSRPQIEDRRTLDRLWHDQPAAEITRAHLVMDIGQRGQDHGCWRLGRAASVGAQIGRLGKHFAVIPLAVRNVHRAILKAGVGQTRLMPNNSPRPTRRTARNAGD